MATGGLIRRTIRPTVQVNWDEFKLWLGLECAAAIALPLAIGLLTGHTTLGAWGAIGAFLTNFSIFQTGYVLHFRVIAMAAVIVAIGMFLGALVGIEDPFVFLLIAGWTFWGGMLVSVNSNISMLGVVSTVGLVVATANQATPLVALEIGAAALAGGAGVVVLALLLRHQQGRSARRGVADALRALSSYAAAIPSGKAQLPEAGVFISLSSAVQPGLRSESSANDPQQTLVGEVEHLRTLLAALTFTRTMSDRDRSLATSPSARAMAADTVFQAIDSFARDASGIMEDLAHACTGDQLHSGTGSYSGSGSDPSARRMFATVHALRQSDSNRVEQTTAGVCRAICRTLQSMKMTLKVEHSQSRRQVRTARHPLDLEEMTLAVRSNLTFGSTAFRHALRLTIAVLIATMIYRVVDTRDGYWVVVAVIFIMKPDFGSTIARGTMRIVGTLLGATLATLFLASLRPGPVTLSVLTGFVSVFAYALFNANYGLFTVFLTCLTVFLAAFLGLPPLTAVANRAVDNVIGAGLAIAAVLVWPPWVSTEMPHLVAAYLRAQHRFCDAVIAASANRAHDVPRRLTSQKGEEPTEREAAIDELVRDARLARSNTEAALERMYVEASSRRQGLLSIETADAVLDQLHRLGLAGLTLRGLERFTMAVAAADCTKWRESLSRSAALFGEALEAGTECPMETSGAEGIVPDHWTIVEHWARQELSPGGPATESGPIVTAEVEAIAAMSVSLTTAQVIYNRDHVVGVE